MSQTRKMWTVMESYSSLDLFFGLFNLAHSKQRAWSEFLRGYGPAITRTDFQKGSRNYKAKRVVVTIESPEQYEERTGKKVADLP